MKYGYVKCAICSPRIKVADVEFNTQSVVDAIKTAHEKKVELLAFPELCLCGATCGDLVFSSVLLDGCLEGLKKVVRESKNKNMLILLGLPIKKDGLIYDAAVCVNKGEILGVVPKSFLNNQSGFSENRYFAQCPAENSVIELLGKEVPFGSKILFCNKENSAFKVSVEISDDLCALIPPSTYHSVNGATITVNLAATPEYVGKKDFIDKTVSAQSSKCVCGYVFANSGKGESTTDVVYSGYGVIAENGKIIAESLPFENGLTVSEIDVEFLEYERTKKLNQGYEKENYDIAEFSAYEDSEELSRKYSKTPFLPKEEKDMDKRAEFILNLQAEGLIKRIEHVNARCVVLGLSGGLDSTLALIVAVKAMQKLGRSLKDVIAVTMPCFGTTSRTYLNTIKLAKSFGVSLKKVDITKSVTRHFKDIKHQDGVFDVTFENAQARERTQVIMDIANMNGGLVVGTGDLSELALGWATYNGDHMSNYGVNASVPKTLVRHLVKYYASTKSGKIKAVLFDVLDTPVSPELLPAKDGDISQKTEDIVGDYILHDFYLYCFIRCGFSPKKTYFVAKNVFEGEFEDKEILKWLKNFFKRFFAMQFKRSCVPDGVKVGSVSLSPRGDLHMPSDAVASLWIKELEEI